MTTIGGYILFRKLQLGYSKHRWTIWQCRPVGDFNFWLSLSL